MPENRLARETSPYLIQHKDNPVAWWPWGADALAEAQRTGKPILLSVGYAACHWCHVMAHESFEDDTTAAVMNDLFVNIKVDREERPEIDEIYMNALHLLGEQGGWPLTMFLTPKGEPIWGGTYFPKTSQYGRPAFVDVLREVSRTFREEPAKIENNRSAILARLAERNAQSKTAIGRPQLDQLASRFLGLFDGEHGGVRGAPKFPQASILEFLWRSGERTGDERCFEAVELTLARMCEGGIYDHLGGGFSRYSVDERWLVPHFEKMLYDNAQLLELLALAYARNKNPLYLVRARETVEWLKREMTTPEGGFASSLDADSEGEEGKFYVWSRSELDDALGADDAVYFAAHYDVTAGGNFEGHNILNRLNRLPRSMDDEDRLRLLREKLHAARSKRVRPSLDDKVLADWNGLLIAALANAGSLLNEPDWIGMAERAFRFVSESMARGDRLGHSWRNGRLVFPGISSDYAAMTRAAIALHQSTARNIFLDRAKAWSTALETHHAEQGGGYHLTADDAEAMVLRLSMTRDDATPNPQAVTAQNLVRLALLAGDDRYRERADRLLGFILPQAAENLFMHAATLNALDLRLNHAEVVVTGDRAEEFAQAALRLSFLNRTILRAATPDALPAIHAARPKIEAAPPGGAAFICVGETCSLPLTDPSALAAAASAVRPQ
jgi:uncharacterized protein YyaL (SSP411 family)